MNDADLLTQSAADPYSGLAQVAGKWIHFVHSCALRQLGDPMRAQIATAATFLLAARSLPTLSRRSYLMPWLFSTARAVCRAMKSGGSGPALDEGEPWASTPTLQGYSPPADWAHVAANLDDGLASLSRGQCEAVLLKYVANLPIGEVAAALGTTKQGAGQQISAGVAHLRGFFNRRNQFMSPDALVALIQAKAIAPAPASAVQFVTATLLGKPDPRVFELADRVEKRQFRDRVVFASAACLGAVVLLLLGLQVKTMLARLPAPATQPVVPVAARPDTPPPTRNVDPPATLASPTTPWPKTRPVRAVDPVFAARMFDAIRRGDYDAMRAVVERDEGLVNARDSATGASAVEVAASLVDWRRPESVRIAHWLIDNGAVTRIHVAARAGHSEQVLRLLLDDPRRLNAKDSEGLTPLQRALLNSGVAPECEQVAENLLRARAQVDLWSACTLGRADDVKAMLAADPKLATARCQGATPLHWAVRPRRYGEDAMAIAKMLLEAGADPRAADASAGGMTPLHHAAEWGDQVELVKLFLDRGVDVNILDDFGWTPTDFALDRGRKQAAELLQSRGGRRTTVDWPDQPLKTPRFLAAVCAGDAKQVKILLDDTPDLAKSRGATGETPMHVAAAIGSAEIIDLLLTDKADVNAHETNRFGGTPIHWAVKGGQVAAVKHLLSKGADPKQVNHRTGQTLLHVAARYTDDPALIDFLLTLGLDASAKDRFGKTALDWAKSSKHRAIEKRLAR